LLINGDFIASESNQFIEVTNPNNNSVIAKAPCCYRRRLAAAVDAAKQAFFNMARSTRIRASASNDAPTNTS